MSDEISLTIDGKEITVPKGTSVLDAALGAGIDIPHLCYSPALGLAPTVGFAGVRTWAERLLNAQSGPRPAGAEEKG